jgi:hypothetical protein
MVLDQFFLNGMKINKKENNFFKRYFFFVHKYVSIINIL